MSAKFSFARSRVAMTRYICYARNQKRVADEIRNPLVSLGDGQATPLNLKAFRESKIRTACQVFHRAIQMT